MQKHPDHGTPAINPASRTRRMIALVTLVAYIGQPLAAYAQVVAAPTAAPANRPVIDATANGLPLVQITTPSAAGVSRNQFSVYNVGSGGVILNNSVTNVLTQQAGYITGNSNLAGGPARIILNEVTGTNPSLLNGYTEVAGARAEVIIANPNGITCNGCGFINTSRGVLTTGTPIFGGTGSLDAFRVSGGQIVIGAGGLNAGNTSQLDLIARSVQVNGALWASNLNVITGANQVNYANLGVQIIAGSGNIPTVGIDVALLGGMYANKILLVGTEAGVGVNSLGHIAAQAGGFTLSNQGQITLAGSTIAGGSINIASNTGIANSGALYSQQSAQLTSAGGIVNSGLMGAQGNLSLGAASLNSTGTLAAGINASGAATQPGNLSISTQAQTAATGTNIAGGSMTVTATDINLANSRTVALGGINLGASAGNINLAGATTQSAGSVWLSAAGTVNNTAGVLYGSQVTANAASIINNGGSLNAFGNISLSAASLDNTNGQIGNALTGAGNITLTTPGTLVNTGGKISSAQDLIITAATITGNGQAIAGRDANISLQGNYTNAAGNVLSANRNLTLTATGNLTNQATLQAVGALSVIAANITNLAGAAINAGVTSLSTAGIISNQGTLNGATSLTAQAATITNNGTIAGGNVSLNATQLIENAGPAAFIGASNATGLLELLAPSIQNRDDTTATDTMATTTIFGVGQVVLAGGKNALGQYTNATQILNQSGLIQSGGNMSIYANTLTNTRRVLTISNTFTPAGTTTGLGYWYSSPSTVPGGLPPNFNIGGAINSSYLYTTWTAAASNTTVTSISPAAMIVSGGNFNTNAGTFQNNWSNIAVGGNYTGTLPTQAASLSTTKSTVYTGDWWYQNYTGFTWTFSCYARFGWSFLMPIGGSCGNGWGPQTVTAPLVSYNSNLSVGGTLISTGATIKNITGATATTPLGTQGQPSATLSLNNLTLPPGGLYTVNTAPSAQYLVVTNPAFANRQQWLSSDWYFAHAGIDPAAIQKRLGDGYYEQQLVRNELLSLTGRAVLRGYADDQAQFMDMMLSGAKLAVALKLAPGMGLSAEQVSKLTDDVIIMETRVVQGQKVLVPVVYLSRVTFGEIHPTGPLIAARDIILKDTRGFTNSGTIEADNTLTITGTSIDNRGGNLLSGGLMTLKTTGDMDFTSASIKAGSLNLSTGGNLLLNTDAKTFNTSGAGLNSSYTILGRTASLDIGGNASIQTGGDFQLNGAQFKVGGDLLADIAGTWHIGAQQTRETNNFNMGGTSGSTEYIHNIGSTVQVGGQSSIKTGRDFVAQGAKIDLQGGGTLKTGGNVELSAVKDTLSSDSTTSGDGHYGRNQSYDEFLTGTSLQSGNSLTVSSGKDITLSSSSIDVKKGAATLATEGNINITADTERHEHQVDDTGSSHGVFTHTERTNNNKTWRTDAKGSSVSGDSITLFSKKDIGITGSDIAANNNIDIVAMGSVNISAATNTYGSEHYSHEHTSGLQAGDGLSPTDSGPDTTTKSRTDGTTQSFTRSRIASKNGNLNIVAAGGNLLASGTDLAAKNGDLSLTAAGTVALLAGQDTLAKESSTLTVTNPNVITKQHKTTTDSYNSIDNLGSTAQGMSIKVSSGYDIILQGAQFSAGKDGPSTGLRTGIDLNAGHDIQLLAAMNGTSSSHQETLSTDGLVDFHSDKRKDNKIESQNQTAQVTSLTSQGDITTHSGHDTRIEASNLDAQGAIDISAGTAATYNADGSVKDKEVKGNITFAAVKDSTYTAVTDSHSSFAWQSQTGHGDYTESIKLANIQAGKGLSVKANGSITVETPEVPAEAAPPAPPALLAEADPAAPEHPAPSPAELARAAAEKQAHDQKRFDDHLQNLAKQPGQAWIAQLAHDPKMKVQWSQVHAAAQHWDYAHEGMTPEMAAVVAIAVTAMTSGAAGSAANALAGSGTIASDAIAAGLTTLASQASVAFINNKGDLGKTFNDLGQSSNVKALALAMVTAGALRGLNDALGFPPGMNPKTASFTQLLEKNVVDNVASATVNHAINGGDFKQQLEQSLKTAFIDTGAAEGANFIGDMWQKDKINDFTHKLAHAIAGCAAGEARAHDCASGALGAVVGEIAAEAYAPNDGTQLTGQQKSNAINFAKVMAGVAAALTGQDVNLAAGAGANAAENNYLEHRRPSMMALSEAERYAAAKEGCANQDASACTVMANLEKLSRDRDNVIALYCNSGGYNCSEYLRMAQENGSYVGRSRNNNSYYLLSSEYPSLTETDPLTPAQKAIMADHQQWANVSGPAMALVEGPVGLAFSALAIGQGVSMGLDGADAVRNGQYDTGAVYMGLGTLSILGGGAGLRMSMGRGASLETGVNSGIALESEGATAGGTGTHNSGIMALAELPPISPAASGGISAAKLNGLSYSLTDLTPSEQYMALQVTLQGDQSGVVTESLVNSVAQRQGLKVLDGGKYGSNNGFDHVFQNDDGSVTILMDSKQIVDGSTSVSEGAGGEMQLTKPWVENVLDRIDQASPAYQAVQTALKNGMLVKGIAGVDRTTGQLTIVRVK